MKKLLLALFALLMFATVPAMADTETDYIKSIIEVGYDYSKVGFESAVSYGDSRTVENFIKSGYNPNMKIAGSFSLISTTFSVVGCIFIFSSAHLTNSGSGSQGVFPK